MWFSFVLVVTVTVHINQNKNHLTSLAHQHSQVAAKPETVLASKVIEFACPDALGSEFRADDVDADEEAVPAGLPKDIVLQPKPFQHILI